MLTSKELKQLMLILSEENKALATLSQQFQSTFNSNFQKSVALGILLEENLLQTANQRIAALYLLADVYRSVEWKSHPFLPVFLRFAMGEKNADKFVEHRFLAQLINENSPAVSNFSRKTTRDIVRDIVANTEANAASPDYASLAQSFLEQRPSVEPGAVGVSTSLLRRCGQPSILSDGKPLYGSNAIIKPEYANVLERLEPHSFEPPLDRPLPPLADLHDDDVLWINPDMEHDLLWDPNIVGEGDMAKRASEILHKALRQQLDPNDSKQLVEDLNGSPNLVHHLGFAPHKLPDLVEHNPLIAIEVLLKLMATSSQITEYFSVLVEMDMSLHGMEVINRLTTAVELPMEFVHLYIRNCIASCATSDRYMQNRLVRLVCVFLQSLLRNKIVSAKDLFVEVQAFCIEYSKIREAAALFKLLKSLESEEAGSS